MPTIDRLTRILSEATYERDAQFRRQAVEYFDKLWPILDDLYRHGQHSWYRNRDGIQFVRDPSRPGEAWIKIRTERVQGLDEHKLIVQVLTTVNPSYSGYFVHRPTAKEPIIHIQPDAWNRDQIRKIFVHEFIHFLDSLRSKVWKSNAHQKILDPREKRYRYHNHPRELNAHFQDAVLAFEDDLTRQIEKAKNRSDLTRLYSEFGLWKGPEEFISTFIGRYGMSTVRHLSPKNYRKWNKRLVEVFKSARNRLNARLQTA